MGEPDTLFECGIGQRTFVTLGDDRAFVTGRDVSLLVDGEPATAMHYLIVTQGPVGKIVLVYLGKRDSSLEELPTDPTARITVKVVARHPDTGADHTLYEFIGRPGRRGDVGRPFILEEVPGA